MRRNMLFCTLALAGSLWASVVQAQQEIVACNGKSYHVGDTLIIGHPKLSKYLFLKQVGADGSFDIVSEDVKGRKVVITEIPDYDKKLYENMGLYGAQESLGVVMAQGDGTRYCISLNSALCNENIVSDYYESKMENAMELTPEVLFVYALKLYNVPVDDKILERYIGVCDKKAFQDASEDPFAMDELKTRYKQKLADALAAVDFNNVFRMKCISGMEQYDMEKSCFPLEGLSFMGNEDTKQVEELSRMGYCLWGECAFLFKNKADFAVLPVTRETAKSFYSMRKYAEVPSYDKPVATLYVYAKFRKQPVTLPAKKVMVMKEGKRFDWEWSTLDKVYGKRALDMDIVRMDGYSTRLLYIDKGEVFANYLGSAGK